ncbi:MAG: hypothetical protein ACM4D3_05995 [Candidatus Sericytochromatia bacterium]
MIAESSDDVRVAEFVVETVVASADCLVDSPVSDLVDVDAELGADAELFVSPPLAAVDPVSAPAVPLM